MHEITKTDGIMLAGQPAWHGLGTVLPTRTDAFTALQTARLNWEVEVAEISATLKSGAVVKGGANRVVVRSDTGEVFATCKAGYRPIQNVDLAELAYEISNASECAVETAGSIRGGRKVWFLLDMGTVYAAADDKIKPYLFICTAHDLSMPLEIGAITTRVVCANTMRIALRELDQKCIRIKHTAAAETRVAMVKDLLQKPMEELRVFGTKATQMAEQGISDEQLQAYFTSVWQRANGALTQQDVADPESRRSQRYLQEVTQWLKNFRDDARQTDVSTKGTVWAAMNSVTQYANHERTVRNETEDPTRRLDSVLFGTAADLNKSAYDAAVALLS